MKFYFGKVNEEQKCKMVFFIFFKVYFFFFLIFLGLEAIFPGVITNYFNPIWLLIVALFCSIISHINIKLKYDRRSNN